ncbi:hypothetical protein [Streptomyces sp. NPDC102283]|uniref:hypothetical protein n=1 Tax=Streptomyces sp. NPDC102283 TaxID=3366155 RepID=UPI00380DCCCD
MDLLDSHRGRLTSHRLPVLVKHMPRDSAVAQEFHGEASERSVCDYLLAAAVDHLAAANWTSASVDTDEDAEQPASPVPVPRPGEASAGAGADAPEPPSRGDLLRLFS